MAKVLDVIWGAWEQKYFSENQNKTRQPEKQPDEQITSNEASKRRLEPKALNDARHGPANQLSRARTYCQRLEPADAICPSLNVRGCCSLECVGYLLGGSDATARFRHGTWYCGYLATRGPGAATGEDEAYRLRSLGS